MKYSLLVIFTLLSKTLLAQYISVSEPSPKYGCPYTTHSITIQVKNVSGFSIPNGTVVTATLAIKDNTNTTTLGTTTQIISTGFPDQATLDLTISNVAFAGPMKCNVIGNVSFIFITQQNIPIESTYTVQYPPTLAISELPTGSGNVTVSTSLNGYSVRYYENANYSVVTKETTFYNYETTVDATYTAKAYDPITTCISQNPSNAVEIRKIVTTGINSALQASISTYPNPASEDVIVTLEHTNAIEAKGTLVDAMGAAISTVNFYQTGSSLEANIHVGTLTAGMYILRIQSDKGIASTKVFVK